jgi:predicted secreted Zn-dependent protease
MSRDLRHLAWWKSSASTSGNCVEVAADGALVLVRNTRDRSGGVLAFTGSEWEAFVGGVHGGEFGLEVVRARRK